MNIVGKKVILRAIELSDAKLIVDMFNDEKMESLVVGWSFPLSLYSQEQWIKEHYKDSTNLRFVIQTNNGEAVGIATLTNIDWKNKRATHGIKIASGKNREAGIGTDTIMAITRYAFDELGLNRLDGSWFTDNLPSKNVYMKCGWKEEGVRRKYIYKNGTYKDLVMTGILATDYYALIKNNRYWEI